MPSLLICHFVVNSPSTPTGPRAWMRPVLIPTSAPSPKRKPSANRVEAFLNTHAASTRLKNSSPASLSSLQTIASVWPLPYLCIQSIASSIPSTTSTMQVKSPYSHFNSSTGTSHRPAFIALGPPRHFTPAARRFINTVMAVVDSSVSLCSNSVSIALHAEG